MTESDRDKKRYSAGLCGTKRVRYLEDNKGALAVTLTKQELKEIDSRVSSLEVVGERYTPEMMALVNR